jgi:FtsP/CotA-like multicopper oxidase with cupredoxin domain
VGSSISKAAPSDPKAFVYAFDGGAFPNVPLLQPRLNSVEEWKFINHNNDEHPVHIHVNDFQVMEYFDPTTGLHYGPNALWSGQCQCSRTNDERRRERY